jgi:hypothetical protein
MRVINLTGMAREIVRALRPGSACMAVLAAIAALSLLAAAPSAAQT